VKIKAQSDRYSTDYKTFAKLAKQKEAVFNYNTVACDFGVIIPGQEIQPKCLLHTLHTFLAINWNISDKLITVYSLCRMHLMIERI
jgi:hypothetical protein